MSVRLAAMAALVAALVNNAHAAVIYVKAGAAGLNNGSSWLHAYRRLQPALAAARSGDQIWIAAGTYKPTAMLTPFTLPSGVKLYGGFAGGETSIDERDWVANLSILDADLLGDDGPNFINRADNARTILELNNTVVGTRIDGLVFRGGYADTAPLSSGGAIHLSGGFAAIENCLFVGNSGNNGGAVACSAADQVRFRSCVFTLNQATAGNGGGLSFSGTTVLIEDCQFVLNVAGGSTGSYGGGAHIFADSIEVNDSVFSSNRVDGFTAGGGGGLRTFSESALPTIISGCTFTANEAVGGTGGSGGGLEAYYFSTGTLQLARCRFTENSAVGGTVGYAGAVNAFASLLEIVDCDFIENIASDSAGAIQQYSAEAQPVARICGSRFVGNISDYAAALSFDSTGNDCLLTLTDSLICGNQADRLSIVRVSGIVELENSTIAHNSIASDLSGAALVFSDDQTSITNTIFWANDSDGNITQQSQFAGPAIVGSVNHSCISGLDGSLGGLGNFDSDPLFFDPDGADDVLGTEDDLYTLRAFSPCIDAGDNAAVPADLLDLDADADTAELLPLDVYGRPRFSDDIDVADTGAGAAPVIDIGAVELQLRSCPADLVHDGTLDFFDVQEFLSLYSSGNLAADYTFDGTLDFFDVLRFLQFFNAGCP